jgi:NADPH-dependent ferric siderophore reductase
VQVARVEPISHRMRRITFSGEVLADFTSAAADDHVKLFFPAPGDDRPVMPSADGSGGAPAIRRDYTPRRFDSVNCELVIEFVIHGDGPASTWAAQAAPGQWLGVGGPRGSMLTPDDYDTYLLAGDETALPAIARHLEEMPPGVRALVLIEVADAREERHLPTAANASVQWLHRNGVAAGQSTLLDQALRALMLPSGDTYAWLAGEIDTIRRLRRYLTEEEGLPREQIRAAGYWRLGEADSHGKLED